MPKNDKLNAEDVNYWMTSNTSPDTWIDRAIREITTAGGTDKGHGFLSNESESIYFIYFEFGQDGFHLAWPVLRPKQKSRTRAARIQAATALYREVKAACIKMKFLGARKAFMGYLLMPDGKTVDTLNFSEIAALTAEPRSIPELAPAAAEVLDP